MDNKVLMMLFGCIKWQWIVIIFFGIIKIQYFNILCRRHLLKVFMWNTFVRSTSPTIGQPQRSDLKPNRESEQEAGEAQLTTSIPDARESAAADSKEESRIASTVDKSPSARGLSVSKRWVDPSRKFVFGPKPFRPKIDKKVAIKVKEYWFEIIDWI